MMLKPPSVDGGLLAAGLLVAAAGAVFLVLGWAATPRGFGQRVRQADSQIARAEATMAKAPRETRFAASALCSSHDAAAAAALQNRLQAAATTAGVTLTSVATAPADGQAVSVVAPIRLSFEVTGRYDAVISMLSALASQSPQIFTDSADLTSQVSSVDFKFSGEVFCSA